MSINLMVTVWDKSRLPEGPRHVLVVMANWSNDDGVGLYASHRKIAQRCGISRATTIRRLLYLRAAKVLAWETHGHEAFGRNEYRINVDAIGKEDIESAEAADRARGDGEMPEQTRMELRGLISDDAEPGSAEPAEPAPAEPAEPAPVAPEVPAKKDAVTDYFDRAVATDASEKRLQRSRMSDDARAVCRRVRELTSLDVMDGRQWATGGQALWEAVGGDMSVIEAAVAKLQAANMTLTGPWSIVKTATAMAAEGRQHAAEVGAQAAQRRGEWVTLPSGEKAWRVDGVVLRGDQAAQASLGL
jgi:hypothetical protein